MFASNAIRVAVVTAFLLCVPRVDFAGEPVPLWRLQREVEQRERQVARAECDLAEARARLALAEGKRDRAIAELRKVVAFHESELRWIQRHHAWYGDGVLEDRLATAERDLAEARARLADTEGATADLVAALKQIVRYHEKGLQRMHRLEMLNAARPEDVRVAQAALDQARARLAAAEKRLAAERREKSSQ
jgi:multidrug resistance efflux pump